MAEREIEDRLGFNVGLLNHVANRAGRTGTSGAVQDDRPTILSASGKTKWQTGALAQ